MFRIRYLRSLLTVSYTHLDVYKRQIQEYGKIKALGATKKQMKQLIFREGIFLTFFSIPVGLLLGFLIAKCDFNWLVEQGNLVSTGTGSMSVQNQQVPLFSLPVILLCIFVSFLTVALALRKPMKIVSRISPKMCIRDRSTCIQGEYFYRSQQFWNQFHCRYRAWWTVWFYWGWGQEAAFRLWQVWAIPWCKGAVSYTHLDVYKRQLLQNLLQRRYFYPLLIMNGKGLVFG